MSFGWVVGGCVIDSCWCCCITCNGVRRVCCRSVLLKCILSCGDGSGSCGGGDVDVFDGHGVGGDFFGAGGAGGS